MVIALSIFLIVNIATFILNTLLYHLL